MQVNQYVGKKVVVTGSLQPGRFIVKRKRGDQDGYIVLAPFIVGQKYFNLTPYSKPVCTKFLLNLGWVPKDSKGKIKQAAATDILPFDDLPEYLADEEEAPFASTITAYIRKGEQSDLLRGYNNWKN